MACSGCDARREWLKRKAKLLAQATAALLKQQKPEKKPDDELARRQDQQR